MQFTIVKRDWPLEPFDFQNKSSVLIYVRTVVVFIKVAAFLEDMPIEMREVGTAYFDK